MSVASFRQQKIRNPPLILLTNLRYAAGDMSPKRAKVARGGEAESWRPNLLMNL
jgi:hypothetical protein